jgi:hypothetical protein
MDQELTDRLTRIETTQGEIKAMLTLLLPMLQSQEARQRAVETGVAELTGEMRGQFNQLGQRISDLNARLPVTLAYAPPKTAA